MAWARKRRRRIAGLVIGILAAPPLAVLAGLFWSEPILTVEHAAAKADVLVILGGEPRYRPARAFELFEQGAAPRILISGDGDADYTRRWLQARGVPRSAIQLEAKSKNTQQNAEFSVSVLRKEGTGRVVLVTSWFHSRRALACFRKAAPEMTFVSLPTVEDRPTSHWPNQYERGYVLREYLKLAGYWLRYGVWPW